MIDLLCTHCGAPLRVRPDQATSAGRCPRCRKVVDPLREGPTVGGRSSSRTPLEVPAVPPEEYDYLHDKGVPGQLGRIGGYRVLKVLGAGAMGVVFEAEDLRLHRHVALKVMKKARAKKDENREEFLKEARATAAIEHDHIVTIYEVNEDGGVPYLAMKLLVGESLEDRLNRTAPLPPEEVIRIGREIAEGLAEAHDKGLIHRDIKPANVWLEEGRDRVKIVDFGLVRRTGDEAAEEAERNFLIGTPLYMSPEQARGGDIDERTDLFSVGAVLYRAATGKLPFKGKNARAVIEAVKRDKPKPPREVNPKVPPYLSRLIMDLLEKKRDERPLDARRLITMLDEALSRVDEVPPEETRPVEAEAEEEPSAERRRVKPRPVRRKEAEEPSLESRVIRWSVWVCVLVALLLAVIHVARTLLARRDTPPAPAAWARPAGGARA